MGLLDWLFGKKTSRPIEETAQRDEGSSLQTDERLERDAEEDRAEITARLRRRIEASGLVHMDRVPELVALIANDGRQRTNISRAVDGDTLLSVDEKRVLGLNTRMKYTREFISFFRPEAIVGKEPRSELSGIQSAVVSEVGRLRSLERFRRIGCERVRIEPLGDPEECSAIKRHRKVFPIADVPTLPLARCRADVCRCMFVYELPE
ncbi:hypothetical protein [Burkholderia gladioli]|uniref:hypothetical protein n=1 Tax=Burkholderia gladioli TaxID=28095 RepID=UPI001FC8491A|nr:hypothetical protein [Burkholderia gladioli]MDN7724900.1 hypothetical protein [Burkholderia gladioli]